MSDKRGNTMNENNLIAVLRDAADEIEKVRARNLQLDREIAQLKHQYRVDIDSYAKARADKENKGLRLGRVVTPTKAVKVTMSPPPNAVIALLAGVSKRALKVLARARVIRVSDLNNVTIAKLSRIERCGVTTLKEIKGLAQRCGITLK